MPTSNPTPLHLLRALLREASYLPDAAARTYIRRYVVARFKAYQPQAKSSASFDVHAVEKYRHRAFARRPDPVIDARASQQMRKARKGLNFLRRANQGERSSLQKVLHLTYGRIGRRRHTLLADLLKPDPTWSASPAPLHTLYRSDLKCLQYFDAPQRRQDDHNMIALSKRYPRLRVLVASQAKQDVASNRIRRHFLRTPALNVWQRPMPLKRAANNVRRWYAATMATLLPPLPNDEWDHLYAMSRGERPISFANQRARPGADKDLEAPSNHPTLDHLTLDRLTLDLHHHLAIDTPPKADKPRGHSRPHHITTRFMQRLYARLLQMTPKLDFDPARKQWNPVWGSFDKPEPKHKTPSASDALFAGVTAKGVVPKQPVRKTKVPGTERPRTDDGQLVNFPFYADYLPTTHPMRIELDKWKADRDAARAKWFAAR